MRNNENIAISRVNSPKEEVWITRNTGVIPRLTTDLSTRVGHTHTLAHVHRDSTLLLYIPYNIISFVSKSFFYGGGKNSFIEAKVK